MTYVVHLTDLHVAGAPPMWTATLEGQHPLSVTQASPAAALAQLAIAWSALQLQDSAPQNPRVVQATMEFTSGSVERMV